MRDLVRRVERLEKSLQATRQALVGQPREVWLVEAKTHTGESWPSSGNIFSGVLLEPYFTVGTHTDIQTRDLADRTDDEAGAWIDFHCFAVPSQGAILKVWREPGTRNWFVMQDAIDMVVYTPSGGIAARSGTTVSSALCTVVSELISSGTNTIAQVSGHTVRVYNFATAAVSGSAYIVTSVTVNGTRYAVLESC